MTSLVESVDVAGAILTALKADASLVALVPAARIYPEITPGELTWPFMRIGTMTDIPVRHDVSGPGANVLGSVHVFAKASAAHPDPSKFCKTVNRHVARILEAIDAGTVNSEPSLSIHVTQAQELPDGAEAGARHGVTLYEALSC